MDLLVHFNKLIGSPAVVSFMICFRRFEISGFRSSILFRPPPEQRILSPSASFSFVFSSFIPFIIVGLDKPVSSYIFLMPPCIFLMPPCPSIMACMATNHRACDSFNVSSAFNIISFGTLSAMLSL